MTEQTWDFGDAVGVVAAHTDVTGPAARTGHRLRIEWETWSATVRLDDGEPVHVDANIAVDSLQVRSGEGGLTPLTGPEKLVTRSNALKTLKAKNNQHVTYQSVSISKSDNGYHIDGSLTIAGRTRRHPIEVVVGDTGDGWDISVESTVSQSDFGVKPFALMMGALKVADDVRVVITASRSRE